MTTTPPGTLDIQEQVACIERAREETHKFLAEQHWLIAEAGVWPRSS